jgi:hypothetical protein
VGAHRRLEDDRNRDKGSQGGHFGSGGCSVARIVGSRPFGTIALSGNAIVAQAARWLQRITSTGGTYSPAAGRVASRCVAALAEAADTTPPAPREAEQALTAYGKPVPAHPDDYALQEDAGRIVRDRARAARREGGRAAEVAERPRRCRRPA